MLIRRGDIVRAAPTKRRRPLVAREGLDEIEEDVDGRWRILMTSLLFYAHAGGESGMAWRRPAVKRVVVELYAALARCRQPVAGQ